MLLRLPNTQELALVGTLSYFSYLAAEVSGLSGILALFCCGVAVSHWALPAMSRAGATATTTAYATLSHLSEGIIFLYVGMDALDQSKWKVSSCACIKVDAPVPIPYLGFKRQLNRTTAAGCSMDLGLSLNPQPQTKIWWPDV